jgi:hypothetical protein
MPEEKAHEQSAGLATPEEMQVASQNAARPARHNGAMQDAEQPEQGLPIESLRAHWRRPPKPKRPADIALWRFATLANRSSLSPRDWECFYRFISLAAQYKVGWDHHDVARRLTESDFSEELARELGEIYWHCRCVLFVRGRHYSFGSYEYGWWSSKRGIALT